MAGDDRNGDLFALGRSPDLRQRIAEHVLHDEEELAILGNHVQRRHHVGVPDARRQPGFVEEHRDELRVLRELGVEPFDGHRASEASGSEQAAIVHRGHPPSRDLIMDRVPTDDGGGHTA